MLWLISIIYLVSRLYPEKQKRKKQKKGHAIMSPQKKSMAIESMRKHKCFYIHMRDIYKTVYRTFVIYIRVFFVVGRNKFVGIHQSICVPLNSLISLNFRGNVKSQNRMLYVHISTENLKIHQLMRCLFARIRLEFDKNKRAQESERKPSFTQNNVPLVNTLNSNLI